MDALFSQLIYALGLTSISTLLLGLFVSTRKQGAKLGKIFLAYCLGISWWSFFQILHMSAPDREVSLMWAQVMEVGAFFIPTLFLHFVSVLLELKLRQWILPAAYTLSFIIAPLNFTPYMINDPVPKFYIKYMIMPGPIYFFAVLFFLSAVVYGNHQLYRAYSRSAGVKRRQLAILFWSSVAGYIGGAANFLYVFNINIPLLSPFGTYAVPIYVGATSYAIIKHQFMDIRTVIHKTAMWAVTSSLFVIPIGLLLFGTKQWIDKLPFWQFLLLIGGLFVLSIPYMRLVQPKIDHLFQRRLYDLRTVLERFMREVAIVRSIPDLAEKLVGTIRTVLYTRPATLLLWRSGEQQYTATAGDVSESIDWDDPWLHYLRNQKRVVELAEIASGSDALLAEAANSYAARSNALFCLPLHRDGLLVGVVNIGPKRNLKRFTQPEREFLETLRVEATVAFTNSLLYDEVKQMSEELERKVEERTRELTAANQKLKETQSQLIQSEKLAAHGLLAAGVLHEINNPLSFARGSMSVLKRALGRVKEASQGAVGPLLAEAERAAEIVQNGHDRIAAIVKDLKTFAKKDIEGLKPSDLHHDLDATLSLLRHELGDRIAIHKEYGEIGPVEVNAAQINQVFLNILQNAAQAIPAKGEITIKTWREGETVFVSIHDTGTGIPPEIQPRIFEPFFTTKPVGKGTGLGLSVSHRIVGEHGGRLSMRSVVGKGSEFIIELPSRQPAAIPATKSA
jgi:signal transduction histidine kinase